MATFVHEAPVQHSKPEIILVADQSTSMRGGRTKTLVAALRVFLESLPVAIKFNICYFGTYPSFLFPKSQEYDQKSLEDALRSLDGLDGNSGGTETLNAIRASIESRDIKQPLSIILATDGDIWQQQVLFDYLNDAVAESPKALRVFALGIGNSVSRYVVLEAPPLDLDSLPYWLQTLDLQKGWLRLLENLSLFHSLCMRHETGFASTVRS